MNDQSEVSVYEKMVSNPLAPMTLRVGVAGHRTLPKSELSRIRKEIRATYEDIDQAMQKIAKDQIAKTIYAQDEDTGPVIRIISSLAEGADRLCINPELIPFKHEPAWILPFPANVFTRDFSPGNSVINPEQGTVKEFYAIMQRIGYYRKGRHGYYNRNAAVIELDGNPANRDEAYNNCSRLLVEHSDILISVYDGDNSTDNGTAATVKTALQKGIPVIHISTEADQPRRMMLKLPADDQVGQQDLQATLLHALRRALLFSDRLDALDADVRSEIAARFKHYRADRKLCDNNNDASDYDRAGPIALKKEYKNCAARAFDTLTRWLASTQVVEKAQQKQRPQIDFNTTDTPDVVTQLPATNSRDRYYAAFLYADRLANYFSRTHRSTFVLIYLLGAAALIVAALALLLKSFHGVETIFGLTLVQATLGLVLLELVLLIVIYTLYRQDRHQQKYHKRWLEYRHLAEALRPQHYLTLLNRTYSVPPGYNHAAGQIWQTLYIETLHRWMGFNRIQLDSSRIDHIHHITAEIWLKGQIGYHSKNAAVMGILGKKLENCNHVLFFMTLLFVVLKLVVSGMEWAVPTDDSLHELLTALTYPLALGVIVLPILATTTYAIRNHAEFDISAQRSLAMRAALISIYQNLSRQTLTADQMAAEMNRIAEATTHENSDWLEIFKVKQSEI